MRGFAGIVAAALLVGGCGQPAELSVDQAWVRLPAVSGRPGAAYFTVHGGAQGDTLLSVSTPAALRSELHESMAQGGVTSMRPIRDLAIPANGTLAFAPGGRHVMLFDLGPQVQAGATIPLALSFAGGKRIEVQAKLVGAGDPAPE
jgi:periplasmic copper chaperone A